MAKLKPVTHELLLELEAQECFSRLGKAHNDHSVRTARDWQEVTESINNPYWEDVTLEAANQIGLAIQSISRSDYRRWNSLVHLLKPTILPMIERKIERFRNDRSFKVIEGCVQWDILHWCLESEFSDFNPPGFFQELGHWYLKGHLPCGWEGQYPEGRLIVY